VNQIILWIWFILAAVMFVAEMFTAGFFLFWFGVGALIAGVLTLLGFGPVIQWTSFIVISGGLLAISRRFADKVTKPQPDGIGANRLVGKSGVVLETIDNVKNTGRVRMEHDEWRAESETDETIAEGAQVTIVRVNGTRLIVRTQNKQ